MKGPIFVVLAAVALAGCSAAVQETKASRQSPVATGFLADIVRAREMCEKQARLAVGLAVVCSARIMRGRDSTPPQYFLVFQSSKGEASAGISFTVTGKSSLFPDDEVTQQAVLQLGPCTQRLKTWCEAVEIKTAGGKTGYAIRITDRDRNRRFQMVIVPGRLWNDEDLKEFFKKLEPASLAAGLPTPAAFFYTALSRLSLDSVVSDEGEIFCQPCLYEVFVFAGFGVY